MPFDWFLKFQAGKGGLFAGWPFGTGFTDSWLAVIGKFVFIGLVLAGIIWVLKKFFGPGGSLREDEKDFISDQEVLQRTLDIFEKRLSKGVVSREDFEQLKRIIDL